MDRTQPLKQLICIALLLVTPPAWACIDDGAGTSFCEKIISIGTASSTAEIMHNTTDDFIEMQGVGGADDTDIRFDLDGTGPVIESPTDTTITVNDILDANTLTEGGSAVFNSSETPGGELGNTWASPTVDTTHSGSAHHAVITNHVTNDASDTMAGELTLNPGVLFLQEQAEASADVGGQGQLWVNTATPNELWFTDDAGTDVQLGTAGAESDPTLTDDVAVTIGDNSSGDVVLTWDGDAGTDGTITWDVSDDDFNIDFPIEVSGGAQVLFHNTTDAASNVVVEYRGNTRATPASNDELLINYTLQNTAAAWPNIAQITVIATDKTSGTEDGKVVFDFALASNLTEMMSFSSFGSVFNETGYAFANFRVEASGVANALFVEGTAPGGVSFGTSSQARNTSGGVVIDWPEDTEQLVIAGDVSQTLDIFRVENNAGVEFLNVSAAGALEVGSTGSDGVLIIHDNDGGGDATVTITPADATGTSYTLTLPPDDGAAGEQLQTDGAGVLTWEAAGSGTGAFSDAADPVVLNTTTKDVHIGDGAGTLTGKLEIGGDADQPQLVIELHSAQADDGLIVQQDDDTELFSVSPSPSLKLLEVADAPADTAGYGQIWVNTATPNELYFTDDAGTDVQLGAGGGGGNLYFHFSTGGNAFSANGHMGVNDKCGSGSFEDCAFLFPNAITVSAIHCESDNNSGTFTYTVQSDDADLSPSVECTSTSAFGCDGTGFTTSVSAGAEIAIDVNEDSGGNTGVPTCTMVYTET